MNTKYQRNTPPPPPPYFLIRNVLICFLFLIAVPAQSQTPSRADQSHISKRLRPADNLGAVQRLGHRHHFQHDRRLHL